MHASWAGVVLLLLGGAPGCYLAHERPLLDTGVDAALPDAARPVDSGHDAGRDDGHDAGTDGGTDAFVSPDAGPPPECTYEPWTDCNDAPDITIRLTEVLVHPPDSMHPAEGCVQLDVPPVGTGACGDGALRVRVIRCAGDRELDSVWLWADVTSVGPRAPRFWSVGTLGYDRPDCACARGGISGRTPTVGDRTTAPMGPETRGFRDYEIFARDLGLHLTACAIEGPHF